MVFKGLGAKPDLKPNLNSIKNPKSDMHTYATTSLLCGLLAFSVSTFVGQSAVYKEVGGIVVIEAENADKLKKAEDDDHAWTLIPDQPPAREFDNARGGKYLQVMPDAGQNRNNPDAFLAGPHAEYKVEITRTGVYRLWLRWSGFDGASDSMYGRILEISSPPWYRYARNTGPDFAAGGWHGDARPEAVDAGGGDEPANFNITAPGIYTISLGQREDGCTVDAIILQLASLPDPSDPGPPESPKADATPQPLAVVLSPSPDTPNAPFDRGIGAVFQDGTTQLAQNSVVMELDGAKVTPTVTREGTITTVSYVPPKVFLPNSVHRAKLEYKDNQNASFTKEWSFTVRNFVYVTPSMKVNPDTSKPGFLWRIHQNNAAGQGNTNSRTEDQLAGAIKDASGNSIDNHADPNVPGGADGPAQAPNPSWAPITFEVSKVINFSQQEGENNGAFVPDLQMPGIPGIEGSTDSIAAEIITFLELPAGIIRMGVNSDDGFLTSIGLTGDVLAPALAVGEFNGGRGAADTVFSFVVEEAGVYPFRTTWEEGGGGANIEWFTFKPGTNTKVLINDTANGGVKAYRAALLTSTKPAFKSVSPRASSVPAPSTKPEIAAVIKDGSVRVDQASITMSVNGQNVTPTVSRSGDETRVAYTPAAALPEGSKVVVTISFKDSAGATRTESWSFNTEITVKSFPAGTLFIEAEDADYGKGQYVKNKKIGMDGAYPGGAYAGLGTADDRGIDWFTNDNAGQAYRPDTGIAAGKENGSAGAARGTFDVQTWWTLGWNDANEWYNYTRDFPTPEKDYRVYGNVSSGGAPINIRLDRIVSGRGLPDAQQVKQTLGFFRPGRATAGWDNLEIFPLTDASGNPITVKLGGTVTLRTTILAGSNSDQDYFAFVPSAPVGPPPGGAKLTATRTGNTIRIEWTGGGTLESADAVTGPWSAVAGSSSPATITISGTGKFYRVRQ